MTGLSAITRMGQTKFYDDTITFVDFQNDRFALDGQRLMVVNDVPYGENGAEYKTEIDANCKIVSYTCDTTIGPAFFKVWMANGAIAYYGFRRDSRIGLQAVRNVSLWLLDSIVDRNGNYMTYHYVRGNANYFIDYIAYTGNHTNDSTVARYLRIARGVKLAPSVYPEGYNAKIVAHDFYVPQNTFEYQHSVIDDFEDVYFCPGDVLNLTTLNHVPTQLNGSDVAPMSFLMWDFDPEGDPADILYVVPNHNATINAIYGPGDHWFEVVTREPTYGYEVDYYGNVTISTDSALAWLISTTNGLNGQRAQQFHNKRITIVPIAGGYDMGAHLWTPLGNINNPFSGTFYGGTTDANVNAATNTHIKNITVNEDNLPYVGFFGNLDTATVQDVYLESEFLKGNNYVGGLVAVAHSGTDIQNNQVHSASTFSGSYCVGGLIGQADSNVTIGGSTVQVTLLGNAIYAGGLVGYQGYNVKIGGVDGVDGVTANNIADVDASKLQSAFYLGGLSGVATHVYGKGGNDGRRGRMGRKPNTVSEIADLRNNYVRLVTNGNAMFAGGLMGSANNVNLSNNYVYGRVHATNQAGGLVGQMGGNVTLDHCYYMDGISTRVFGLGSNTTGATKYASFKGNGKQVKTAQRIDGVDNMTRLLNRWVRQNNEDNPDAFLTWTSDTAGVNSGYPIFGAPDMVPVNDTLIEVACDEYNYNGTFVYQDTVIQLHYIDTVEMVDSTFTLIISMGQSETELFFDSVADGDYYMGHGFVLSAEELSMLRGVTDANGVKTVQIIDSLVTQHGCDSVVVLNLTIYVKGDVGIDVVEPFDVKVYPNPTRGKVTVESDDIQTVEVYDAISRRVVTVKGEGDQVHFDLTPYPTGSYYLRVTTSRGIAIKKVIKK